MLIFQAKAELQAGVSRRARHSLLSTIPYTFFQVDGVSRIRTGQSSRRPASMQKDRTILDRFDREAKLPVGPTRSKPGPMLFKVAATAENA